MTSIRAFVLASVVALGACDAVFGTTYAPPDDEAIVPFGDWQQVVGGDRHACALQKSDGSLWCWGRTASALFGTGEAPFESPTPRRVGIAAWTMIAARSDHMCGIQTDGALYCWGANGYGQVGVAGGTVVEPTLVDD